MIVKCTVTQEMIDKNCHEPYNCPIAEATLSKLRDTVYVNVSWIGVYFYAGSYCVHRIKISYSLSHWLSSYDHAKSNVQPIEFELDIPESHLK